MSASMFLTLCWGSFWRSSSEQTGGFLDETTVRKLQSVSSPTGSRAKPQPTYGDMELTTAARRVLRLATEQLGRTRATPLHLLRAVLAEGGPEAQILLESGITLERIKIEIPERDRA